MWSEARVGVISSGCVVQMQGGMGGGYDTYDPSAQYFMQPGMQGVLGQVRVGEGEARCDLCCCCS